MRTASHFKLQENLIDVVFHIELGQSQYFCDFPVGFTFMHPIKNFLLPLAQALSSLIWAALVFFNGGECTREGMMQMGRENPSTQKHAEDRPRPAIGRK